MNRKIAVVATVPSMVRAFLVNHIKNFSKEYDVTVISNFSCQKDSLDVLPNEVKKVDLPILRPIKLEGDIKALFLLIRYFYREKFTIVYSGTPKGGLLSMIAARINCVPIRIHTFTGQVWVTRKGINRYILKLMDCLTASLATVVLVDSQSQREYLINNNVVKRSKSLVLGDGSISGFDPKRFYPNPDLRSVVRKEMKTDDSTVVFLFVGRLKKEKGLFELAKAFTKIYNNNKHIKLWIIGPDEEDLQSELKLILSSQLKLVNFIPYTFEPEKYMVAADVFCMPSYREGFGSTILEAAACGIPTIGSRIYGIIDAIVDGDTGILVEKGNINELASAMLNLAKNRFLRNKMGTSARKRAIDRFQQSRLTCELSKLINKYCSKLNN